MTRLRRPRKKRAPRVSESLAPPMGRMAAGEFKARCLEMMDRVNELGEEIVITKYGKPVARLVPAESTPARLFGALKGSVLWYGDVISPVEEPWDAERDG